MSDNILRKYLINRNLTEEGRREEIKEWIENYVRKALLRSRDYFLHRHSGRQVPADDDKDYDELEPHFDEELDLFVDEWMNNHNIGLLEKKFCFESREWKPPFEEIFSVVEISMLANIIEVVVGVDKLNYGCSLDHILKCERINHEEHLKSLGEDYMKSKSNAAKIKNKARIVLKDRVIKLLSSELAGERYSSVEKMVNSIDADVLTRFVLSFNEYLDKNEERLSHIGEDGFARLIRRLENGFDDFKEELAKYVDKSSQK